MVGYAITGYRDKADSQVQFIPLSFIHNGGYAYDSGWYSGRNEGGYYWGDASYSNAHAQLSIHTNTTFHPQGSGNKGSGYSIRCLVR